MRMQANENEYFHLSSVENRCVASRAYLPMRFVRTLNKYEITSSEWIRSEKKNVVIST